MSTQRVIRQEVSVDEQGFENESGGEEGPVFQPSVEQEIQGKIDANHPDGICEDYSHLPLAQAERIRAREAELEHISAQAELGMQDGRAERTRQMVVAERREQRQAQREPDPRERLSHDVLAKVNREAARIADRVDGGPSRAAVARSLAARVNAGQAVPEAVFSTLDEQLQSPGVILPIAEVSEVPVSEVSVEGQVLELWAPSTANVQQVGLIGDDTARTKFTVWKKSRCRAVTEGETVKFRAAKVNWYQGRWSLALTSHSRIEFPERDPWWEE